MDKWKTLHGSTLKLIAVTAMLIDHFGTAILLNGFILQANYEQLSDQQFALIYHCYEISRIIGRLAFPLFCFLAVEGFAHTRNVKRYMVRLLLFALISEPIYDLAQSGKLVSFEGQNVMFTLFLGLLTLCLIRLVKKWPPAVVAVVAAAAGLSYVLRLDGWYYGILMIAALHLFYDKRGVKFALLAAVMFLCGLEFSLSGLLDPYFLTALSSVALMALYNGERGLPLKYAFYLFYPGHLLILFLLAEGVVVPMLNQ